MPGQEPQYLYGSTFHWKPIVNGYSGYYPPTYLRRVRMMEQFPSPRAIEYLREEHVRYVVIHEAFFKDGSEPGAIILGLQSQNILPLARLQDGFGTAVIFTLQ